MSQKGDYLSRLHHGDDAKILSQLISEQIMETNLVYKFLDYQKNMDNSKQVQF
jgi:hypothetical protein